jgi:hypothetical protein
MRKLIFGMSALMAEYEAVLIHDWRTVRSRNGECNREAHDPSKRPATASTAAVETVNPWVTAAASSRVADE